MLFALSLLIAAAFPAEERTLVVDGRPLGVPRTAQVGGVPLALDSYWGLVTIVPMAIVLVFRILDEEQALAHELAGYPEYMQKVHARLVPYVW